MSRNSEPGAALQQTIDTVSLNPRIVGTPQWIRCLTSVELHGVYKIDHLYVICLLVEPS